MNFDLIKKNQYKFYFLMPALTLILIFFALPNILNFFYAFTDWSAQKEAINFRGFANFIELSENNVIWESMFTTIKFALSVSIMQNILGLSAALALEKSTRFNTIMRTVYFVPVIFSPLAASYIFQAILSSRGTINSLLNVLFETTVKIPFLGSQVWTIYVIAIVHSWKWFGFTMIVYLAALKLIPRELLEAARVEGASGWKIITKIKLPLIGAAFTFNAVTSLAGSFSVLEIPWAMTRGGPGDATEVLNILILEFFGYGRMGYATAGGLVLFLLVFLVAVPMIIFMRKREVEL